MSLYATKVISALGEMADDWLRFVKKRDVL